MKATKTFYSKIYTSLKLKNLDAYLRQISKGSSYRLDFHLERAVACGLTRLWLYYRALGIEQSFFNLLAAAEEKIIPYREIFYGIELTNRNNKFYPKLPVDLLKINLPKDFAEAEIAVQKPEFAIAFVFTTEQLKTTLQKICLPNKMICLGDKQQSIGLMADEQGHYFIYHAGNEHAVEYATIDACVAAITSIMQTAASKKSNPRIPLFIERYDLDGRAAAPAPDPIKLLEQFLAENGHDHNVLSAHGIDPVYLAVRAGLQEQVKFWREKGLSFGRTYIATNLLALAAHDGNKEMVLQLLQNPEVANTKAAALDLLVADHAARKLLHECTTAQHASATFMPSRSKKL